VLSAPDRANIIFAHRADERRQDHRHQQQRRQQGLAGKRPPRKQPGQRQGHRQATRRHPRRDHETVADRPELRRIRHQGLQIDQRETPLIRTGPHKYMRQGPDQKDPQEKQDQHDSEIRLVAGGKNTPAQHE